MAINAPDGTIDGLLFQGGATTQSAVIQYKSHDGIVPNTAIIDYTPPFIATECHWVSLAGDNNVVERCDFRRKNSQHPLIGNTIEDSRRTTVPGSYFKNIPYVAKANGREIIRVWGSGKIGSATTMALTSPSKETSSTAPTGRGRKRSR